MYSVFNGGKTLAIVIIVSCLTCASFAAMTSLPREQVIASADSGDVQKLSDACSSHDVGRLWVRTSLPSDQETASRFYGDALPGELLPVYDVMRGGAFAGEDKTQLPFSITKEEAKESWAALKLDCPELMFTKPPLMVYDKVNIDDVVAIRWDNRLPEDVSEQAVRVVSEKCTELSQDASSCDDVWQKAVMITHSVAELVEYDETAPWAALPYGAAMGKAHCEGTARLAVLAMRECGLLATPVLGMAMREGQPQCHEWVAVFDENGECRWYDPTWVRTDSFSVLTGKWQDMTPASSTETHRSFYQQLFE